MVEIVPRPRRPNLFVQVSVAVVSGAAAMYFIQTVRPAANAPTPAAATKNPPSVVETKEPGSAASAAPSAAADSDAQTPRFKAAPPAAVSMLVVPEPGGAPGGIVAVGEDGSSPAGPGGAGQPSAGSAEGKATPLVHLQPSGFHSRFADQEVGQGFQSPRLPVPVFQKRSASRTEPGAPRFLSAPRIVGGKGVPEKDVLVPSTLHPEVVPERPFWDDERTRKAAVAGLIALSGGFYLLFAAGFFRSLVAKPRFEDEPRI